MPTYEYKCRSCGKIFEKFQSMTEAPLAECPTCKVPLLVVDGKRHVVAGIHSVEIRNAKHEGNQLEIRLIFANRIKVAKVWLLK